MAHWLDRLYVRLTPRGSFFQDGWGDRATLASLAGDTFASAPAPLALAWTAPRRAGLAIVRDATFESPSAASLPPESRRAHVRWSMPAAASASPPAVCVLLGATGDEGFARRTRWAAPLLSQGVGVMLLENPFYGARRPRGQRGVELRTVSDLLLLGRAAVEEARALGAWLAGEGFPVALSGYSMGGQLAAMAGALAPFPAAIVAAAAPSSATAVFVEGLLSRATDWRALGGDEPRVRAELARTLDAVSLATLPRPLAPHAAILMGAKDDGYVAAHHVEALHAHWRGAELRWMPGGHVSGYVGSARAVRAAVVDAVRKVG